MTVFILGGGPTGLALVDGLVDGDGPAFVLVERERHLGGLATTLDWDGGSHDLGPHKLFSTDRALVERVRKLLPEDGWLTRPKRSRIFMRGRYLPYPPSPLSLVRVFGLRQFSAMLWDYAVARLSARGEAKTFEDDLRARLGGRLYGALFAPIARKLWGDPATLDVKLSRGRVQTPSIGELVLTLLRIRRRSAFEATEFFYPRGGLRRLWASVAAKGASRGEWLLGWEVARLEITGEHVSALVLRHRSDSTERTIPLQADDVVFSTLPLARMAELLHPPPDEHLAPRLRASLLLNDLVLVFLRFETRSLLDDSWIFVPEPTIAFHRISEQESFDPGMTPEGTIVCCEIMSGPTHRWIDKPDEELVAACRQGLAVMGYALAPVASRVIRLRSSYPVFVPGYDEVLRGALAVLDRIGNLRSIGRQGAFNYIGSLDAMDIGYGAARWWLSADRRAASWDRERERTTHYPVLD